MIAFEVSINGEDAKVFGFEDWTILNAIVMASKGSSIDDPDYLEMRVGGLAEQTEPNKSEHVRFGKRDIQIGDHISLKIVDTDEVNKPIKRYRSDRDVQEDPFTEEEILEMEREEYERLKLKFETGI